MALINPNFNKIFSLFFIIRVLLLLISKLKIISAQETSCDSYDTCGECTTCHEYSDSVCECEWKDSACQSMAGGVTHSGSWFELLNYCSKDAADTIYCSEKTSYTVEDFSENRIRIKLNQDDNKKFGKEFSYCFFEYIDEKQRYSYDLSVVFDSAIVDNKPSVYYNYSVKDDDDLKTEEQNEITENFDAYIPQLYSLQIKVLLRGQYGKNPITITIQKVGNHLVGLIVSFVGIFLTIIVVIIICFTKNYYHKKAREQLRMLRAQADLENIQPVYIKPGQDEEQIKNENMQKLTELFQTTMAEQLYKKEYNQYGGGCSICLENFNKKSTISITSCNHAFHYKCIYEWLFKNILCPKCPNCNNEVLKDFDNPDNRKYNYDNKKIQVKKRQNNDYGVSDISSQNEMMVNNNNYLQIGVRNENNNNAPNENKGRRRRKSKK